MGVMLVTGGAGFIGSHIVTALLERGETVRVLDDLSSGKMSNLAGLEIDLQLGDIRDPDAVKKAFQNVSHVFHHAAMISVPASMDDPMGCYQANLIGSINIFQQAAKSGVERIVCASSCAVYGDGHGALNESTPPHPLSPYADSKLAMENAGRLYTQTFGVPVTSLRYFNVYGPRQDPNSPYAAAIPIFINAMLAGEAPTIDGDGGQTRNFVYVEDVVRANLTAAAAAVETSGDVYNIGGHGSISILELVSAIRDLLPESPAWEFGPPRKGDILHSAADIRHAESALGYRPLIALEDGLKDTVQWFMANSPQVKV
jgi:UDP-glucose 4-epimerase